MQSKPPRSPFATRLSGSAKEVELRLRNIFLWKRKRPPTLLVVLTALAVLLCCGLVSCQVREEPDAPEDTAQDSPAVSPALPAETLAEQAAPAQVTPAPAEEWSSAFRAVLLGQAGLITQTGQTLDIHRLAQAVTSSEGITAEAARFAVLDLDRDGTPEVILWLTAGDNREFAFLILRHQDGGIVSHPEFTRTMGLLKADGTFTFSGGASD